MAFLDNILKKVKQAADYFNPTSNGGNNFWSSPASVPLVKAQQFSQAVQNTRRVQLPKFSTGSVVKDFAYNLPVNVAESYANVPRNLLVSTTRAADLLGTTVGGAVGNQPRLSGRQMRNRTVSALAPMAESLLDVYSPGIGKNVVKEIGKGALKTGIKAGAISGAFAGGTGSALAELGKDRENVDFREALKSGATGALTGGVLGGAIGGGVAGYSELKRKLTGNILKLKPNLTRKQAETEATRYIQLEGGRLAGSRPKFKSTKDVKFIGDVRESIGLSRTGDEIPQPGLSIRALTKEEHLATPAKTVKPRASGEVSKAKSPLTRTTKPLPQTPPETAASAKPASSPIFPEPAKSDSLLPLKKSEPQGKRLDQILSGQTSETVPSDEIIQQARGEIGSLPVKGDKPLRQQLRDFYTNWVNRFQPLEDVATKVEKETKSSILPQYDPRYTTRRLLGAGAVAEHRHQKVLQPILDELGDIPSSDFDVYLKAKRDLNLGERGIKGSDAAKAQAVIDALGQKYDAGKMESVAQKLYAYQDEGLAMLRDAGIISPEVHARIKDTSKNYVPFQRVMDEVDSYLGLPTQKAYLGSQPVKKIKGSERQILSPVESIIANTYKIESAVSRNRVAQSLVNLRNVAPQYQDMFERVGKDSAEAIAVWENGKKVYYRVGEDIANAVKGLNEESAGILTKILSAPARLLRQGATGRNIDFMIPNVFKDQFDAAISSKYGYRPFVDYFRGLAHLLNYKRTGSDQLVEGWINSGGKMFFENMGGRKQIGEQILDATQKKGLLKQLGEWAGGGIDAIGELSETPTRLGLYMRAKEATGNQWLSMMESREGTLDFARMGAKMKTANAIIPFLNVGVQGFDKLIRAAKDNPAKMALNMTLYAGLPQLLVSLYDNLFHPQEYANIPQWEKDTNFIVVTGQGEGGKPAYLKIPKGNIVPYIANPTDQLVSFLAGNDKQSFGQMALSLLSEGLPVVSGGSSVKEVAARTIGSNIPQAFKPLVENVMNKSTFYTDEQGNPQDIVPYYLEKKPAPQQYKKSTPEAYKALGKILNASPLKAQNVLEGYLSGFIKTPVNIAQMLTDVSKGKPLDPNKVPILRRFYGEREDYQSASAKPQVESRFAANAAEPNFLQRLFNRGVKEEQVQKLPTDLKDLSVIYGEAKKDLDAYNEKKLKIEYGNYEEWEKQSKLEALDSEYQYAKQMMDRIEKEQPEAVLEMNLDLYSSAGSRTVEERSAWAAEQLAKAAGKEEFEKLVDRMLGARVLTKSVVEALRKQGVNVSRYTEGGKVKSFGGTGSAKSTKSLAAVFKAMRADNEEAAKLSQPSKRKLPTALSLVLKQSRPKKPSADSLDRILSQKRSQARKPIDVIRGLQRL